MRLLSVALTSISMDRWQGSVGRPCGQDYRGGADGVSGGNRHQVRIYSSCRSEDSTRCGNIGGIGSFSKRNRYNRDFFDYDKLASAVLSGISSPQKKLPKLETARVKDIRAFLNSLEETEDLRNCFVRDLIPSFVRQRMHESGYAGPSVRISDEDLLDCLHICAFPKRELDGITAEELLCSAARSVAPATDAADMARFIGSLTLCANLWRTLDRLIFS